LLNPQSASEIARFAKEEEEGVDEEELERKRKKGKRDREGSSHKKLKSSLPYPLHIEVIFT
jgi:hypothetical protein